MANQKIRIRLKAYDHRLIDRSASEIVETAKRTGRYGSRSDSASDQDRALHHSDVAARRQRCARPVRDARTHKRVLDIVDPNDKTVDALMKLDLAAGVDVQIKLG